MAIYHGSGEKCPELRNPRAIKKRAIDAIYPGFLDNPWTFTSEQRGAVAQRHRRSAKGKI